MHGIVSFRHFPMANCTRLKLAIYSRQNKIEYKMNAASSWFKMLVHKISKRVGVIVSTAKHPVIMTFCVPRPKNIRLDVQNSTSTSPIAWGYSSSSSRGLQVMYIEGRSIETNWRFYITRDWLWPEGKRNRLESTDLKCRTIFLIFSMF